MNIYKNNLSNINEKFSLVTGASSGIGKEMCKILFNKGYNLIIIARNKDALLKIKQELYKIDPYKKVEIFVANLSNINEINNIFEFTEKNNLNIEVLINNAGTGIYGEITQIENNKLYDMLMLNIYALTYLSSLYANKMKIKKQGYILNIASLAAYQPVPYIAAYAASKSYVLNFSEAIAMELKDYGITVTCVSPGHTNTNFFKSSNISDKHKFYGVNTRVEPYLVANYAIDCLFDKKFSCVYGMKNKFLSFLNKLTPRILTAYISKKLVTG